MWKSFQNQSKLEESYNHSHDTSGKIYHCNVCTKSFQAQNALTIDIKGIHIHGGDKSYKCDSRGKSFSQAWRHISTQFMKDTKITNVNTVANHFRMQEIWKNTSIQSIKAAKITNVKCVENRFLMQEVWKIILTKSIQVTNTNLVLRFANLCSTLFIGIQVLLKNINIKNKTYNQK